MGVVFSVEGGAVGSGFYCGGVELLAVVFNVVVEMDYPLLPGVDKAFWSLSSLFIFLQ